jgi:hypothetical protein
MTLEAVVIRGQLYPQRALSGYLLEWARYVEGPVYDPLSMALVRAMTWWDGDER